MRVCRTSSEPSAKLIDSTTVEFTVANDNSPMGVLGTGGGGQIVHFRIQSSEHEAEYWAKSINRMVTELEATHSMKWNQLPIIKENEDSAEFILADFFDKPISPGLLDPLVEFVKDWNIRRFNVVCLIYVYYYWTNRGAAYWAAHVMKTLFPRAKGKKEDTWDWALEDIESGRMNIGEWSKLYKKYAYDVSDETSELMKEVMDKWHPDSSTASLLTPVIISLSDDLWFSEDGKYMLDHEIGQEAKDKLRLKDAPQTFCKWDNSLRYFETPFREPKKVTKRRATTTNTQRRRR